MARQPIRDLTDIPAGKVNLLLHINNLSTQDMMNEPIEDTRLGIGFITWGGYFVVSILVLALLLIGFGNS